MDTKANLHVNINGWVNSQARNAGNQDRNGNDEPDDDENNIGCISAVQEFNTLFSTSAINS